MSWVSPQDILDRWVGPGAPDDEDLVQALINDAEAVVLAEYPAIQTRINNGTLPVQTLVMVVSRMTMRVLRNPEALSYSQMATGPFSQGKNYGSGGGVDIWMTSEEEELLAPKRKGKAFALNLAPNALPGIPVPTSLMNGNGYIETPNLAYTLDHED